MLETVELRFSETLKRLSIPSISEASMKAGITVKEKTDKPTLTKFRSGLFIKEDCLCTLPSTRKSKNYITVDNVRLLVRVSSSNGASQPGVGELVRPRVFLLCLYFLFADAAGERAMYSSIEKLLN